MNTILNSEIYQALKTGTLRNQGSLKTLTKTEKLALFLKTHNESDFMNAFSDALKTIQEESLDDFRCVFFKIILHIDVFSLFLLDESIASELLTMGMSHLSSSFKMAVYYNLTIRAHHWLNDSNPNKTWLHFGDIQNNPQCIIVPEQINVIIRLNHFPLQMPSHSKVSSFKHASRRQTLDSLTGLKSSQLVSTSLIPLKGTVYAVSEPKRKLVRQAYRCTSESCKNNPFLIVNYYNNKENLKWDEDSNSTILKFNDLFKASNFHVFRSRKQFTVTCKDCSIAMQKVITSRSFEVEQVNTLNLGDPILMLGYFVPTFLNNKRPPLFKALSLTKLNIPLRLYCCFLNETFDSNKVVIPALLSNFTEPFMPSWMGQNLKVALILSSLHLPLDPFMNSKVKLYNQEFLKAGYINFMGRCGICLIQSLDTLSKKDQIYMINQLLSQDNPVTVWAVCQPEFYHLYKNKSVSTKAHLCSLLSAFDLVFDDDSIFSSVPEYQLRDTLIAEWMLGKEISSDSSHETFTLISILRYCLEIRNKDTTLTETTKKTLQDYYLSVRKRMANMASQLGNETPTKTIELLTLLSLFQCKLYSRIETTNDDVQLSIQLVNESLRVKFGFSNESNFKDVLLSEPSFSSTMDIHHGPKTVQKRKYYESVPMTPPSSAKPPRFYT